MKWEKNFYGFHNGEFQILPTIGFAYGYRKGSRGIYAIHVAWLFWAFYMHRRYI